MPADSSLPSEQAAIFSLPSANPAIQLPLDQAELACRQASQLEQLCRGADKTAASSLSHLQSLLLSAESACQIQQTGRDALLESIKAAQSQQQILDQRINEVARDIQSLTEESAALRKTFIQAVDDKATSEPQANDRAKELLACLETVQYKQELLRRLRQYQTETGANITYLRQAEQEALQKLKLLEELARELCGRWRDLCRAEANGEPVIDGAGVVVRPRSRKQQEEPEIEAQEEERPSAWATIWSYTKLVLVAFLLAVVLRAYVFDITRVEGTSMFPTLNDGDSLITAKITYLLDEPARGEIVVLEAPDIPGEDYIKRVIALPNEELTISNGQVYINGVLLDEPYLNGVETAGDIHTIVPTGFYFVMGDNRPDSRDSRVDNVGFISSDDITGQAVWRVWPLERFGDI